MSGMSAFMLRRTKHRIIRAIQELVKQGHSKPSGYLKKADGSFREASIEEMILSHDLKGLLHMKDDQLVHYFMDNEGGG